jgi:hypothetical protein
MAIPKYGDVPYVRRLQVERDLDFELQALKAVAILDGRPFPSNPDMLLHWLEGQIGLTSPGPTLFCAQLVAATFIGMGLLPSDPPSNFYDPKDFSTEYERLNLQKGARLEAELQVVLPPDTAARARAAAAVSARPPK